MFMCRLCASTPVYVLKLRTVVVVIYRSFVCSIKLKKLPSIQDQGQTDRVTTPRALKSANAVNCATPYAFPR